MGADEIHKSNLRYPKKHNYPKQFAWNHGRGVLEYRLYAEQVRVNRSRIRNLNYAHDIFFRLFYFDPLLRSDSFKI